MPTTAPVASQDHNPEEIAVWITLASMFVGERLDKRAAVGAYIAAALVLGVSAIVLFFNY